MISSSKPQFPAGAIAAAARCLGAAPEAVDIAAVTGDASTRTYFRARAGDSSAIIALYRDPFDETERAVDRLARLEAANPSARLTFANDPCAHLETTSFFRGAGLPVPRIFDAAGRDGALIIEDVGDARLQDWLATHNQDEAAAAYGTAVELIVQIQAATACAWDSESISSHLAFDAAKLRWELGFFFANYFNRYLHLRLDPVEANGIQEDFKAICTELGARPRVLAHRDYHARNLMMPDARMVLIDFQDARMGPASYDLASLLFDPYTSLDRDTIDAMVEFFIQKKQASPVPLEDVREFRRELELMTVQRMLKAVGTYASQAAIGNTVYLPYIRPAVDRALAAMKSLERFESTQEALERTLRDGQNGTP